MKRMQIKNEESLQILNYSDGSLFLSSAIEPHKFGL